ncbi:MAG TPA: substrate-binding domain-containing protein [Polyangiaceae bacterium]|nr:substrate-binding domain-containing protein [Polyangiaceae bacterium]
MQSRLRRRVAVLLDAIEDDYQSEILEGIRDEADKANVSLLCLAGGVVTLDPNHPSHPRNFLFELFDPRSVDGVLVLSGALGNGLGPAGFGDWMRRFLGVPLVNLGLPVGGMDSVTIESGPAMGRIVKHLALDHKKASIAFIRGPVTSQDAEERFAAYRDALTQAGLQFDPQLVVQGNWLRESGARGTLELIGERHINLRGVGAIVCANDYMALGALDALRTKGIDVPGEVLVSGFDDLPAARTAVPSLTTARQPTHALGKVGLKRLLQIMAGPSEPSEIRLEAEVNKRASCGCHSVGIELSSEANAERTAGGIHATLLAKRALIVAELARAARGMLNGVGSGWEERWMNAFLADMAQSQPTSFVTLVEKIAVKLQSQHGDVAILHGILDAFRRGVRPALARDEAGLARAADLFDSARRLIGDTVVRDQVASGTDSLRILRQLSSIAGAFLRPLDAPIRREEAEAHLLAVGIDSISMARFAQPGHPESGAVVCLLLGERNRLGVREFESGSFAPREWLAVCKAPVLVQPLTYDGTPLGLLAIPWTRHGGAVYEQMKETLSVGLFGALRLGSW